MKAGIGKNHVVADTIEPAKEAEAIVDSHVDDALAALGLGAGDEAGRIIQRVVLVPEDVAAAVQPDQHRSQITGGRSMIVISRGRRRHRVDDGLGDHDVEEEAVLAGLGVGEDDLVQLVGRHAGLGGLLGEGPGGEGLGALGAHGAVLHGGAILGGHGDRGPEAEGVDRGFGVADVLERVLASGFLREEDGHVSKECCYYILQVSRKKRDLHSEMAHGGRSPDQQDHEPRQQRRCPGEPRLPGQEAS